MTTWGAFAAAEPELAAFVAERLRATPSYPATVRASGAPRVHPVTPIFTADGLYLFMEPTSPKAADLRERGWFALHNGVPDNAGTGGEASVSGTGHPVDDAAVRATVVAPPATAPPTATCCSSCDRPRCVATATATSRCPSVDGGAPTLDPAATGHAVRCLTHQNQARATTAVRPRKLDRARRRRRRPRRRPRLTTSP